MALHWNNLNSIYPRMLCAKLCWNWPCGSGEEIEHLKSLRTDGRTDRREVKRKAHSGELKSEKAYRRMYRCHTRGTWQEKLNWAYSSNELIQMYNTNWYILFLTKYLLTSIFTFTILILKKEAYMPKQSCE